MTCIVGIEHKGRVYIGGDSSASCDYRSMIAKESKVFINGEYAFGFTSSFRMGQIIQHSFVPPSPPDDTNLLRKFLCTDFVAALRISLKDNEWAKVENGQIEGGTFLLGVKGKLFRVDSDFQVSSYDGDYTACGSGEFIAIGSLHTTRNFNDPIERLTKALLAAETHNPFVRSPFNFVNI